MPQTPHIEQHFTAGETLRDIVIGMSDGLTVPFALAAGLSGAVSSPSIIVTAGLADGRLTTERNICAETESGSSPVLLTKIVSFQRLHLTIQEQKRRVKAAWRIWFARAMGRETIEAFLLWSQASPMLSEHHQQVLASAYSAYEPRQRRAMPYPTPLWKKYLFC